ncbi:similar to Saccharomyces cerevisiae YGR215W RSM27 Mitochondrial ribosomal protein of the small subunit [Maudiozyma barnettii]|uniref:Small ribosomal subunit protein mS33 n=1 Tax=Maudiozyma barnettii TaxID=61262 RepID=A0A8H2VIL0_9SACH|nr:mitochondrial 37S ribosomal protein RSM27 [Kazachstania barnettii]CAB4256096.1 similar to Saccharomyces cerevisiae YGR215W RSM27 Mitochondrial ribosomal protein of the small subunit [Kazachstania barnettii]CAD1784704.1 similar to Saccharomyces cerevisiae YGR215W RSM27 Mitochondrial ribosomal protein of the small subunit [Kazachstania barnettii]
MSIPKERLLKLAEISAKIFDQNFNPSGMRTGSKVLSKRLKGPSVAAYYGNPDFVKFKNLKTLFPDSEFIDEEEQYRLSKVEGLKRRGKGAPKKTKKGAANGKSKKK